MAVDIDVGADVYASDGGRFGLVSGVVLNPARDAITHIVVRWGVPFAIDVVIPIDLVGRVVDHDVTLTLSTPEAASMPPLEAEASVPLEVSDQDASGLGPRGAPNIWVGNPGVTLPPLLSTATNVQPYVVERWRNVPEQSLVLRDGLPVRVRDGERLGEVDEVVVDPASHAVTDIVVRLDRPRGRRKVIPSAWVESSDEETGLLLAADRDEVMRSPDYH